MPRTYYIRKSTEESLQSWHLRRSLFFPAAPKHTDTNSNPSPVRFALLCKPPLKECFVIRHILSLRRSFLHESSTPNLYISTLLVRAIIDHCTPLLQYRHCLFGCHRDRQTCATHTMEFADGRWHCYSRFIEMIRWLQLTHPLHVSVCFMKSTVHTCKTVYF